MTSKIFAVLSLAGMIGLGGAGRAAVRQGSAQDTTQCHPSRHGSPPPGHDAMTHRGDPDANDEIATPGLAHGR